MLKQHYGPRTVAEAMIDYLSQFADWDDQIVNQGESLTRWGRRIIHENDYGTKEYVRCASVTEAIEEFDRRRFPDEYDGFVYDSYRDGYSWSLEGVHSKERYDTREEAELGLAKAMVDGGCFPQVWFIDERGGWDDIDDDIRKYHDDGGDKMHPRFAYADAMYPHYVDAMLWSTTNYDPSEESEEKRSPQSFQEDGYTIDDISEDLEKSSKKDILSFVTECWEDLKDLDPEQSGHDFWLTREGHGAGFWDRGLGDVGTRLTDACKPYGSVDLYATYLREVDGQ